MNHRIRICSPIAVSVGLLFLSIGSGCDHPTQSSAPTTRPTVMAATTQPSEAPVTVAAYPVRPPSFLNLDGRDVSFPAAKLALIGHAAGGFTLRLCSDDPPTAIDPGYAGNSYVLDMRLSIDHLSELPSASWDYKPTDENDSTSGIYLHGYKEQYHPDDVHISFAKQGDELLTYINGTFLRSDANNPAALPEHVTVTGCLHTDIPTE